jgi:gliding motility-associated-like protein
MLTPEKAAFMLKLLKTLFFLFVAVPALASHITGGEMYYTYLGKTGNNHSYRVTLKLFQRCGSGRQFPANNIISIFNRATSARVTDMTVQISGNENIRLTNNDPCITNAPDVCYDIAYYTFDVSLPETQLGYVLASQINYRIEGINNLTGGNIGATYTCEIPGFGPGPTAPVNKSARFTGSDLVIVCANNEFTYSFGATDEDGDGLRYYFCPAYASTNTAGGTTLPTNPPPFPSVPYGSPFSGSQPLGPAVSINPANGTITGMAPPAGVYVVTVCVEEIRNGEVIARQRKDLQIHIADCDIAGATLLPEYSLCGNSLELGLQNMSTSPLISSTEWTLFDSNDNLLHSSNATVLHYTLPFAGDYRVKLVINRNQSCTDSTEAIIHAWPGFEPAFEASGFCFGRVTGFTDQSSSFYGSVNSWSWDFGEFTNDDQSSLQHPEYTYLQMGPKTPTLVVTDTKGCRDTVSLNINIIDKPPIGLPFRDTLICNGDVVPIQATGNGVFSWTPLTNITGANTANPSFSPATTTTYYVDLDEDGCLNRDSVRINVVDFVTLSAMADTLICRGDTIRLRVQSDGLQYQWTPAPQILDPNVQNPFVVTHNLFTDYEVTAVIGGCSATDRVRVSTVPYPLVFAGNDTSICYNSTALLQGNTDGSSWNWSPAVYLGNAHSLQTPAHPPRTTAFVLTVTDNDGCPKPSRDTVLVTVYPKIVLLATGDTAVLINQPLQLQASGAEFFTWSPPGYFSDPGIADPIVLFPNPADEIRLQVTGSTAAGCQDSAFVKVRVFRGQPTVYVPSAFTPNNDGRNDVLRPIAVGFTHIEYFNVYNRWGQLIFSTRVNGQGWDGRINGRLQDTGSFVWTVKAVDYTGRAYFEKGIFTLIR